jgi:phosphomevalonate kinase
MKARAPGKVVLSGAYSVLWGAPAIVTAVDRYVEADSTLPAQFVSRELEEAMPSAHPRCDATLLRAGERKLGLGSSAAILAAALGCVSKQDPALPETRAELFERALFAHRRAQGGGSGVDVAASVFGGTLAVRLPEPLAPVPTPSALALLPNVTPISLPQVVIEVWASPEAAVTADFIRGVSGWAVTSPTAFAPVLAELVSAADAAVDAAVTTDAAAFVAALDRQSRGLERLGASVGLPICVPEVIRLAALARAQGATVLPAGAGGGDVSLFVGLKTPSEQLRQAMRAFGLELLELQLGVAGVHRS